MIVNTERRIVSLVEGEVQVRVFLIRIVVKSIENQDTKRVENTEEIVEIQDTPDLKAQGQINILRARVQVLKLRKDSARRVVF